MCSIFEHYHHKIIKNILTAPIITALIKNNGNCHYGKESLYCITKLIKRDDNYLVGVPVERLDRFVGAESADVDALVCGAANHKNN